MPGAVAFVRTGYPETETFVLRRFGSVSDDLQDALRRELAMNCKPPGRQIA
jgi:hypothetical protein